MYDELTPYMLLIAMRPPILEYMLYIIYVYVLYMFIFSRISEASNSEY